ncbi:MAG: ABC transporter permease [Desulfurivibrio sp.]
MEGALAKQLNLLDFALSSLWRRRWKNLGVLLIFTGVIFLLASFHLVTNALTERAGAILAPTPDIVIQKMSAGRQESIPLAYQEQLRGFFGIRQVVPRIWGYYFDEVRLANFTVIGVDPGRMPLGQHLGQTLATGEFPAAGADGPAPAAVGGLIASSLDLAPGGFFSLFRPDLTLKSFTVSGIFKGETDLLTADLIAVELAQARDLFQIPAGLVTDLCVYVHNPAEVDNLARRIAEVLPDTRVLTREQISRTYQAVFGWRSGMAAVCLLAALAAFAILAWDKASGLSPEERREVAVLKIVGWETPDLLIMRGQEALVVAGGAFLLGLSLAWVHVLYFDAALFRPVLVGWSAIYPAFALAPKIVLQDLLLLFALTVPPYLAATVIPTWRSASVPAEDALNG